MANAIGNGYLGAGCAGAVQQGLFHKSPRIMTERPVRLALGKVTKNELRAMLRSD